MSHASDPFLAAWKRKCWKCQNPITVVMDITEWRGPHATHSGMWKQGLSPDSIKRIIEGTNIQFRKTSDVPEGYFANVCGKCDSVQGDWFLNEDLTRFTFEAVSKDFAAYQLRKGSIVKTFNSMAELEKYRFGAGKQA